MKRVKQASKLQGTPLCGHWPSEEYQRAQINRWADALLGIPFGVKEGPLANPNILEGPLRPALLSDADRWVLAMYLRGCALSLRPPGRRGRPSSVRKHYRLATDYLATQQRLGKAEAALTEVMQVWGVKKTTITDAVRDYGPPAQNELKRLELANPDMDRDALLVAISQELRSPGKSAE